MSINLFSPALHPRPCLWTFALLSLFTAPAFAARLVWTDGTTGQVLSAPTDGSGPVVVLYAAGDYPGAPGVVTPYGITAHGSALYWTDAATGQILRGAANGTGSAAEVYSRGDFSLSPTAAAFDVAADGAHLYWTVNDTISRPVHRGAIDGSGGVTELFPPAQINESYVGVDVNGGFVYWADPTGGEVQRGASDGSGTASVLYDNSDYPGGGAATAFPVDVAVQNGFVYWTDPFTDQILRAAASGVGGIIELYGPADLPAGFGPNAQGIAVDDNFVYWADSGIPRILRGPINGSGPVEVLYDISDYPGNPTAIGPLYVAVSTVPEPTGAMLMILPGVGLCGARRRGWQSARR
jgi:hypothetical protein